LMLESGRIRGIEVQDGRRIGTRCVIMTTGTFLNGLIHIGDLRFAAGRMGESPALRLAQNIKELGFLVGRLKTGTPPRLDGRTIDFRKFEEQKGDSEPVFFSFGTRCAALPQVSCFVGHTNERTHSILRINLTKSALYGGSIKGIGPRYCPSIEDKIVKFADKDRHQIFLEPEGLDTHEVYLNGVSTSMPAEVQAEVVHSIEGLENARIIRPGYAIEYDFVDPTELHPTLETKRIEGLFHAGQINGTTGYEEAAAQGLVAGINAVLRAQNRDGLVFPRRESYIGILVDDLVTKGVDEPYRMFTSRSEFRLLLRIDNADLRLSPLGHRLGLIPEEIYSRFNDKYAAVEQMRKILHEQRWNPSENLDSGLGAEASMALKGSTLEQVLRRPEISLENLAPVLKKLNCWPFAEVRKAVEIEIRYEGYIQQQMRDVEKVKKMSARRIPPDFDFSTIDGLSREIREKLCRVRPLDLDMASRIPGVTPAAISILNIYLELAHGRSKRER
jgi:tRNA uridine 5-carboxymethylaminomethyl modification enzyme